MDKHINIVISDVSGKEGMIGSDRVKLELLEGDGDHVDGDESKGMGGGSALGTGNSKCKGPEAGSHLEPVKECLTGGER